MQNGETILHKAALGGQTEVVKMLVDARVNVNAKNLVSFDVIGCTQLITYVAQLFMYVCVV